MATFCVASGHAIFLHAGHDRYLMLPDRLNALFLAWLENTHAMPTALADALVAADLLQQADAAAPIAAFEHRVATRSTQALRAPSGLGTLASVAATYWRVKRSLRINGFAKTLGALPPGAPPLPSTDAEALARRFLNARTMLSIREECLVESLAMLDYLRRRGAAANIVFGVTATPFQAHCWVQSQDLLLNDHRDHVASYTPILAL